jgi:hypothetical protein
MASIVHTHNNEAALPLVEHESPTMLEDGIFSQQYVWYVTA